MIELSNEIQSIPHSPTLWANDLVWEKRNKGESVYHMGFGESPFPVPERLQKTLADNADKKEYYPATGIPELLETIREYYRPLVGGYVDQCDLITAPGSKLILFALQAAIKGDLLYTDPSWVSYVPQAKLLQTKSFRVPLTLDDDGYHIDPDILRASIQKARTEGLNPTKLILNSPNNPAGTNIPADALEAIAKVCQEEGVFIISDEIYGLVSFDGHYNSISKYAPQITAISTGLSKHLSLGGWRFGVGFIPKGVAGLQDALCRYISETWSCINGPLQFAAIDAYARYQDVEDHIQACTDIHNLMNTTVSNDLKALGIDCPQARGAFYTYPNFAPYRKELADSGIKTSQDLHIILLEKYNLATLPGHAFGAPEDVLTLRLSGCDYRDTAADALVAYQNGETLDRAFVEKYAPRILESIDVFGKFIKDITGRAGQEAA